MVSSSFVWLVLATVSHDDSALPHHAHAADDHASGMSDERIKLLQDTIAKRKKRRKRGLETLHAFDDAVSGISGASGGLNPGAGVQESANGACADCGGVFIPGKSRAKATGRAALTGGQDPPPMVICS